MIIFVTTKRLNLKKMIEQVSKISEGWCRFANVAARDVVVPGPNVMALLTVSTESALMEAGNSLLTASVFRGLVGKF